MSSTSQEIEGGIPSIKVYLGFISIGKEYLHFIIDKYDVTESQSNLRDYCHGYFDGETLILPAVLSDGVISSIRMKYTDDPPEFRVEETYP